MILEKLRNKVKPKENKYGPTWGLETDKSMGVRECRGKDRGERGREKGRVEENLREWDGQNGGRTDMRARKEIS